MNLLAGIWLAPRETVRTETRVVVWLQLAIVWAWGAAYALERSMGSNQFPQASFEAQLAFPIAFGLFGGLSYFSAKALAINLTNSWFKGRATTREIYRALVAGAVPKALSLMFFVLLALALGKGYFLNGDISKDLPTSDFVIAVSCGLLISVLTVWSLIATAHTLAEAQGYKSAWWAWLHSAVSLICMLLVLAIPVAGCIMLRKEF